MLKKVILTSSLVVASITLSACSGMGGTTTASNPSLGTYNRDKVCANLRQQLGYYAMQAPSSTNWQTSSKKKELTSAYKANGCDK